MADSRRGFLQKILALPIAAVGVSRLPVERVIQPTEILAPPAITPDKQAMADAIYNDLIARLKKAIDDEATRA